ncbi:MAG TPA: GNAT family N-acetyltransferase [Kofleriaceae bacterium]|nr:GNAT family N-acetyltransferase [Kofleriaceae bacterium]
MEIRDAHPDEHDEIGRLMVEAYACLDGFPKPSEQPAYYAMLERIGKLVDPPATRLLAAIDGGRVLGAVLYIEEMTRYGAGGVAAGETDAAAFRLLAVRPSARGTGAGRALAERCIALGRDRGRAEIVIHSTEAMRIARGLYDRLGFRRAPELDFRQESLPVFGFRLRLRG